MRFTPQKDAPPPNFPASLGLHPLYRGDFFGEMALVDDQARSATAIVGEDTICTVFSKDELDESLAKSDLLAVALVHLLTRRIRESTLREDDD